MSRRDRFRESGRPTPNQDSLLRVTMMVRASRQCQRSALLHSFRYVFGQGAIKVGCVIHWLFVNLKFHVEGIGDLR